MSKDECPLTDDEIVASYQPSNGRVEQAHLRPDGHIVYEKDREIARAAYAKGFADGEIKGRAALDEAEARGPSREEIRREMRDAYDARVSLDEALRFTDCSMRRLFPEEPKA